MAPPRTVTAKAPLGGTTTNRKWYYDLVVPPTEVLAELFTPAQLTALAGTYVPGAQLGLFGITEQKFNPGTGETADTSDIDSGAWKSNEVAALTWGAEGKVRRGTLKSDRTKYDPGQELLRKVARTAGVLNSLTVIVYEMEPGGPRVEAYEGQVAVTWSPDGGGMSAFEFVSWTMTGQGELREIDHPDAADAE
jgi:hypothetical protein